MAVMQDREFNLNTNDFDHIRREVKSRIGISLSPGKRDLVYNRLAARLRKRGVSSFKEYFDLLGREDGDELESFVNALTTNVTSFFREIHHFEFLAKTALPEAMRRNAQSRRLRIWSAGCSSGQEPYSIAMVLAEVLRGHSNWDPRVLATDIDTDVLGLAREGIYREDRTDGISNERLKNFFLRGKGEYEGLLRVRPDIGQMISFRQLNLMENWPMKGPFDVIFCRNVVIYFDKQTQERLWERYASLLAPGGYMIVGHSESIMGTNRFGLVGRTIYKKER